MSVMSRPWGYSLGLLTVLAMLRRVLFFLPVPDSRNKPEMRIIPVPVPEINTGGERQMFNPRVKQA